MRVIGVDACKGGWVSVQLEGGGFAGAWRDASFAAVLERAEAAAVVGVDIPIGLIEGGFRDCDAAARAALGARRSSVFATPPREAVLSADYREACRLSIAATGKSLSKQAHGLGKRILEVAAHAADERIREVHPEVTFQTMGGALASKKSWTGLQQRVELLRRHGIDVPADLGSAGAAAADDIVDAAAAAWTAHRIATGAATMLPDPPTQHDRDRPIVIWA